MINDSAFDPYVPEEDPLVVDVNPEAPFSLLNPDIARGLGVRAGDDPHRLALLINAERARTAMEATFQDPNTTTAERNEARTAYSSILAQEQDYQDQSTG